MKKRWWSVLSSSCLAVLLSSGVGAAEFYPIASVDALLPEGGHFYPLENLIQGPGVGFTEAVPHALIGGGASALWVTDACGFPCDYIETWGQPILTFDLGEERDLSEISVWGYSSGNSNGVKDFSLRFATAADGTTGFGSSITYNPTFNDVALEPSIRQSFGFGQTIRARYVEMTTLDNYFVAPGDGSGGELAGGDRVGLGEVAFALPGDDPVLPKVEYYPIESIEASTSDTDLWPVSNLIQGPGVGFNEEQPHEKILGADAGNWVTEACGFPCDYLESFDAPVLTIDLGADRTLDQVDVWGYTSTNANGLKEFKLRFASASDGPTGFGTSIDFNPTFSDLPNDDVSRQNFAFGQSVTARYVEFTITDNHFVDPGDGSEGGVAGGDRIGMGEIAFPIPTAGGLLGDFNSNGVLDIVDINSLLEQIVTGSNPSGFDLNGDALVNAGDISVWVKDLKKTWIGDADLDGLFNSTDFVKIFQAGKFEVNTPAAWDEGDWTGDLRFNSSDLIAAFQDGGFEAGVRPGAVSAVPEPSSVAASLLALGVLGGMSRRRRQAK